MLRLEPQGLYYSLLDREPIITSLTSAVIRQSKGQCDSNGASLAACHNLKI